MSWMGLKILFFIKGLTLAALLKERAKSLAIGLWGVRVEDTVVVGKEASRVSASIPCQLEK